MDGSLAALQGRRLEVNQLHYAGIFRALTAGHILDKLCGMSTVTEVEAALVKLAPEQLREVADWIASRLSPEETPEILAAIDEGLRSLRTEPTLTAEQVRRNIAIWVAQ